MTSKPAGATPTATPDELPTRTGSTDEKRGSGVVAWAWVAVSSSRASVVAATRRRRRVGIMTRLLGRWGERDKDRDSTVPRATQKDSNGSPASATRHPHGCPARIRT